MENLTVNYYGYVFDASGYGYAARAYINALHRAGITLSVIDMANHARQVRDELVESLVGRKNDPDFHLFHGIPPQWSRFAFRLPNAIGMTVWETDTMPSQWRNILNHVLEVWLPCEFNVSVFSRDLEKPVFKLPHPLICAQSNGDLFDVNLLFGITDRDFVFYSIFEWQDRKYPQGLIEAYLKAFPNGSDTVLIIKTNAGAVNVARQTLEGVRQQVCSTARVEIRSEGWSEAQIKALHKRGNCYVSLHRGEGWGYPLFEAASRGIPVIATNYSGPLEYLNPESHQLIPYKLCSVQQPYHYYNSRMRWAEPDLNTTIERMRWVFEHNELAREGAKKAAEKILQVFSMESVGTMARDRLIQLTKRTQPQKWQRIEKIERKRHLIPTIPIPGEWYDKDYFETGLKSNWDRGYTCPLFAGLFRETAVFLTSVFSEATSYLDIGCAKGFLVGSLRECGKECWGFDHSEWAINHAEVCVKQYLVKASVDEINYDRQFDILLAFSLFESLTESQIISFLSRSRAWTRQAIVATIPSFDSSEEERLYQKDDKDLSHITMHTRQWWHELFLKAGWKQDYLHRVVERICQNHGLPKRMGWKVYVYAPGN